MISIEEFSKRRNTLFSKLDNNSIVLLSGAPEVIRNNDCHYSYRQDSDFYYLTGFEEPQAFLALIKKDEQHQFILFNREKNYQEELWEGLRAGQPGAMQHYGADVALPISELQSKLPELLKNIETVYYKIGSAPLIDKNLPDWISQLKKQVRKGIVAPNHIADISEHLSEMRLLKSAAEVEVIREICELSAKAHCKAMQAAPSCQYEYQLLAEMEHTFKMNGCKELAYGAIVAAGKNACILHYTANDQAIADDDLILIDVGGELQNYAADITRTFPKNGTFSAEQRAIYEIVLEAQKAGIDIIKPGLPWPDVQTLMVRIITEGLISVGLLSGSLDENIEQKKYFDFYMHNSGHWLGLDVHDCGQYKINNQWRPLEAGMLLTVEPGIYIADHHPVDPKWHNIGVRIEDDILVTSTGHENLTAGVPKEIAEIEALMQPTA